MICSACLNNCPLCDSKDPAKCKGCGRGRYSDNGKCLICPLGCKECTSESVCSSCYTGFSLVDSLCLLSPQFPALSYSDNGKSLVCFAGFNLKDGRCVFDKKCNSTSSCFVCSQGFYLSNGTCLSCSLSAGCSICSSGKSSSNC